MRSWIHTLLLLTALAAASTIVFAANMTKLSIVVKTQSGRPITGAEVIVRWHASQKHPRAGFGKAVGTTFEMRSNQEGEASVPAIPQGNVQIQVNAKGYQTFGQIFEIVETERLVEVKLNPPQQQYSSHQ
jgi:hypothetical protein